MTRTLVVLMSLVILPLASALVAFGPPVAPPVADAPFLVAASTSGASQTVDATVDHTVYNTGKTTAGSAATSLVVIGWGTNPSAADYTIESNKLIFEAGGTVRVPRGVTTLYFKSASGAPVIQVIPQPPVR